MPTIIVIKLDHTGAEIHRYQGRLLEKSRTKIVLEAFFDREDTPVGDVILSRGDRFVETYFTDHWYNIFEVHAKEDDSIKCWYCNIGSPVVVTDNQIAYKDLALDLLVYKDGRQVILDEEEFKKLFLDENTTAEVQAALNELRELFSRKESLKKTP